MTHRTRAADLLRAPRLASFRRHLESGGALVCVADGEAEFMLLTDPQLDACRSGAGVPRSAAAIRCRAGLPVFLSAPFAGTWNVVLSSDPRRPAPGFAVYVST